MPRGGVQCFSHEFDKVVPNGVREKVAALVRDWSAVQGGPGDMAGTHAGSPMLRRADVDRRKPLCNDSIKRYQERCERAGVSSLVLLGMADQARRCCL
jgi:hypothetical protein